MIFQIIDLRNIIVKYPRIVQIILKSQGTQYQKEIVIKIMDMCVYERTYNKKSSAKLSNTLTTQELSDSCSLRSQCVYQNGLEVVSLSDQEHSQEYQDVEHEEQEKRHQNKIPTIQYNSIRKPVPLVNFKLLDKLVKSSPSQCGELITQKLRLSVGRMNQKLQIIKFLKQSMSAQSVSQPQWCKISQNMTQDQMHTLLNLLTLLDVKM
ncbi:hypothetical protein pb186bvf_017802 [Paramecium bursaria]